MPNQFLTTHKPSRLWSRKEEDTNQTLSRRGLIGLFNNKQTDKRKRDDQEEEIMEEDPPKKKLRKESVTRFLKKCIPKKRKTLPEQLINNTCEIDVTLPVIEFTNGCIFLCLSDIGKESNKDQEWEDIMHFPKPPNWRASVPQLNHNKIRQRKGSCPPPSLFNKSEDSSDDESDMPRTPITTDHEAVLLDKIENLNIIS